MNDVAELKHAVFSTDTNWILKKVMNNIKSNYHGGVRSLKDETKFTRQILINFLKVDVQTVEPIYFVDKYSKNEHADNIFMFIDKDFKIIGFLRGNTWEKHWKNIESYEALPVNFKSLYSKYVNKNRKNMTEIATHILMFTPEMMTYKINKRKERVDHKKALRSRLITFKENKYKVISHEQVMSIVQELLNHLTSIMFDEDKYRELAEKMRHISGFHNRPADAIRNIADVGDNYYRAYKEYKQNEEMYTEHRFLTNLSEQYKLEIILWNKAILGRD